MSQFQFVCHESLLPPPIPVPVGGRTPDGPPRGDRADPPPVRPLPRQGPGREADPRQQRAGGS